MTSAEKCEAWRSKFPDRAAALRLIVARLLGAPLLTKLDRGWVHAMLTPTENEVLVTVYDLKDDP